MNDRTNPNSCLGVAAAGVFSLDAVVPDGKEQQRSRGNEAVKRLRKWSSKADQGRENCSSPRHYEAVTAGGRED